MNLIENAASNVSDFFDLTYLKQAPCLMPFPQRLVFFSLLCGLSPKAYLEIGTARGGSALIYRHAMNALGATDFKAACIDPAFRVSDEDRAVLGDEFEFVTGTASIQTVKRAINHTGPLDFVLIDGDHRYDYALSDLLLVYPYLQPGAYVALDDSAFYEVRDAIAFATTELNLIDCGLLSRHANIDAARPPSQDPRWTSQPAYWAGLHLLRKPS